MFIKFGIGIIYKVLSSKREFHENPFIDRHTFYERSKRISLRTLYIYIYVCVCVCVLYLSIWTKLFAIRVLHIIQLSMYEFLVNRRREGRTFVIAVL
jgi:hypothetical protein